uniref:Rad50/SbcC-type AAA domain-containing protein n=1 Tax=candidate division WOR-3 bacterium TaxID=2052148 RepID=A0A7V3KNF3_UNCW3
MPRDLILDSITIEGFRGFNDPQTIELNGAHAIIFGAIGTGKSSTLCAIEWALFGNIAHIKCLESGTQAEFVNANKIDQKAKVTLKLKGDDGDYIVYREKQATKKGSKLTFSTPAGKFEGDEAADQIFSIFGTFEDFHRSVFLHQEAVRAIITENPEDRDSALDRLFGLEKTRELMSKIPLATILKECEKLEAEKMKIEERIKGATQQVEKEMETARKEALDLGLKKNDFNTQECIQRFKEIAKETSSAAEDCGIERPLFSEPATVEDVSKGLKKVKQVIKDCRKQIAATSRLNKLQKDQKQINEAKEKLEDALVELKEATEEYEKLEKEWGTIEQIEKRENEIKMKDDNLRKERETVDSTSKLVADGIEVISKQELKNCPICDARISPKDVLSKLKTKVSITLKKRLSEIDDERNKIREELFQLDDRKNAISKAISMIEKLKKAKDEAENALGEVLQSKSKGSEILLKEAEERLSELEKELAKVGKALNKKNEILQKIEDSTEICGAIVRVLEKEAEYEKIRETFAEEDSQIEILKTQIDEMSSLYTRLQSISEAIITAHRKLAGAFISKGKKKISSYYDRLCGHPYYNSIRIDMEQRNVKGVQKNTYTIRAFNNKEGRETLISTRFSMGQMNCAALSIFLSLSSMLERRPKFLILDDPSQSLDADHKKSLVKVLEDVSLGNQVIIATQDRELEQQIETGFRPEGGYIILNYKGWSKEGPVIEISKK